MNILKLWKFLSRWRWIRNIAFFIFWRPAYKVGVSALIFDEQGRVLLFHHTYKNTYPWGMSGGGLKRGERPEDAAVREVKEESNFDIEVLEPVKILNEPNIPSIEIIYRARLVSDNFIPSAEVDEVAYFEIDQLPNMKDVHKEVIVDSLENKVI